MNMNTKATTPVVFVPVTEAEDNRYHELHARHLDLDDKEEAELAALKKKIRAAAAAKGDFIKQMKTDLTAAAIAVKDLFTKEDIKTSFSITDLFTQDEIDASATTKKAAGKGKVKAGGTSKTSLRASDTAIELFFIAKSGSRGDRDFSLHRGRIFERYNDTVATPFIVNEANFPKKLLAHGTSEKELMKFVSTKDADKAKAYLASDEGKAEIKKILEVVAAAKAKLNPAAQEVKAQGQKAA